MSDIEKYATQLMESYKSAVYERDVAAFLRLYDPNVRIFDAWDAWEYNGAAQWRRPIEAWLGAHATEKVKVTFDDVRVAGSREFAVVSAIVTYASVSDRGETLRSMQNRITWAITASGDDWRVMHEHTSAPVNSADAKAMLKRAAGS